MDRIKMDQAFDLYKYLAQNVNCMPMGEGCFHPQLGYLDSPPTSEDLAKLEEKKKAKESIFDDKVGEELKLKTINAEDVDLVECDKGNYFDIFCGRSTASVNAQKFEVEVWFDTSSSMRKADYSKDQQNCKRREFAMKLKETCKGAEIKSYNTSKKQISDTTQLCNNYGTNDQGRLLSWLKENNSNVLVVVTDIEEMATELKVFLDSQGAKIFGQDRGFAAEDLNSLIPTLKKSCKN